MHRHESVSRFDKRLFSDVWYDHCVFFMLPTTVSDVRSKI